MYPLAHSSSARSTAPPAAPRSVVGEAHELVVVLGVRPQAAHGHGHAVLQVPVQPGLGPVRLLKVVEELLGGGGELQLLGYAPEGGPVGLICSMEGALPSANFINTAAM